MTMVGDLETALASFMGHRAACDNCKKYQLHKTATLPNLCQYGTGLYKKLLKAEETIVNYEKHKEFSKEKKRLARQQ